MAKDKEELAEVLNPPSPGAAEPDDAQSFQFVVTSDNFVGGKRGSKVTLPVTEQTRALVESHHVEPGSAKAREALDAL